MAQKIETVNVNDKLEFINNKETKLNKNSIRYLSNAKALEIVEKYEKMFREKGKEYDIKLGVDKSKNPPLYYIIFWENALDIWLKVEQLEKFLTILLDWFQGNPIFWSKELEDYDIPEKSKIWNFIREVSWENFQDPLYNNPKDWTKIEKSQTETNIEKEVRKLEIKTEKFWIHETPYRVLYFGENTIFRFPWNFLPWIYVKFNEEKAVSLTKAVIEWKK